MAPPIQPKALEPPSAAQVLIDRALLAEVLTGSRNSSRKRLALPLHKTTDEPVQRLINAMQPGTYIRPHRHREPPSPESILLLQGRLWLITFTGNGEVDASWELERESGRFGVDLIPGIYHTLIVTQPNTVIFESKAGPWRGHGDKTFAPWAPEENAPEANDYLDRLCRKLGITYDRR